MFLQVLSRSADEEPYGWWPGRIKMMKGDFAVVEYTGWETTYSEIVQVERVRPKNLSAMINKDTFFSCVIDIPEDLKDVWVDGDQWVNLGYSCGVIELMIILTLSHAGDRIFYVIWVIFMSGILLTAGNASSLEGTISFD